MSTNFTKTILRYDSPISMALILGDRQIISRKRIPRCFQPSHLISMVNGLVPHTSTSDNYNQAVLAPPEWWEHLLVKDVLIIAGKDEILSDDIVEFADKLCRVKKEVEFLLAEQEAHGAPTFDLGIPFKDVGQQTRKVREWLVEKL